MSQVAAAHVGSRRTSTPRLGERLPRSNPRRRGRPSGAGERLHEAIDDLTPRTASNTALRQPSPPRRGRLTPNETSGLTAAAQIPFHRFNIPVALQAERSHLGGGHAAVTGRSAVQIGGTRVCAVDRGVIAPLSRGDRRAGGGCGVTPGPPAFIIRRSLGPLPTRRSPRGGRCPVVDWCGLARKTVDEYAEDPRCVAAGDARRCLTGLSRLPIADRGTCFAC